MCLSSSGREDRQCLRVDSGRPVLLTANLHIRFPLLCSTENWDPEEFPEKEDWLPRSVSIQERERETVWTCTEWLTGDASPSRAASVFSAIRGHRSSVPFSAGPLLHWFNYTCNWPSFFSRQDILPEQPTNISECRPLQGGIRKRPFEVAVDIPHQENKTIFGGCRRLCVFPWQSGGCWNQQSHVMSRLCFPGKMEGRQLYEGKIFNISLFLLLEIWFWSWF